MPLPNEKLNQMWWSGFCDETIRHASTTPEGQPGRLLRLSWAQHHMPHCADCKRANKMKNLEGEVAKAVGRFDDFDQGKEFRDAPGYTDALQKVLRDAMARGTLTPTDLGWIAQKATRHGRPWPGREDKP